MARFDIWTTQREDKDNQKVHGLNINRAENLVVRVWRGKATKPFANYGFKSVERQEEWITKTIEAEKARNEYKAQEKRERAEAKKTTALVAKDNLKPGMIFYTSWGYDQTNYDFLVVESVSKTGKTAKCRMTSRLHVGESAQSDEQAPINCPYGKQFTMQIESGYREAFSLRGSYPYCGDSSKRLDSFSMHDGSRTYHQTSPMCGH